IVQQRNHRSEFLDMVPDHVHQNTRAPQIVREPRQMLGFDLLDTAIREPNRVDHSALELGYAWRPCAMAALDAHRLRHQTTQSIEINYVGQLPPIGSCASS